ncbi:MAG: leucine-rich repeat protein [Clostridiales bacterium]|nr:leucine-rich repeat protein [Clostridiales bacterium]
MSKQEDYDKNGFVIVDGRLIHYNGGDKNVVIPDTVKVIGYRSLGDSIERLYIPKSVETIEKYPFLSGLHLAEIEVATDNLYYYSRDNCLIERKTKKIVKGTYKSVIPRDGSVTAIGEGAFHDVDGARFYISNCITVIESRTFGSGIDVTIAIEAENKPNGWADDWDSNEGLTWEETDWEDGAAGIILEWGASFSESD